MIIGKDIDVNSHLTAAQMSALQALAELDPAPDEDNPEMTLEQLKEFRRAERNKQTVTIRLSPGAIRTAKSLGKGYTSVLSRILESALSDPNVVRQFL